jgi:carotenoid cleavage dioxygenase
VVDAAEVPEGGRARHDRRTALRLLGLGGLSTLVACASDHHNVLVSDGAGAPTIPPTATSSSTTPAPPTSGAPTSLVPPPSTTLAPPPTTAYDPARPFWVQGNFAPVARETEAFDLAVLGTLPADLDGLYVRNGPNAFGGGGRWLLGDGMVHGVRLGHGAAAWYRNRFVHTGVLGGADPGGAPGSGDIANTSNTSVRAIAGRLLTMQETGQPFELDQNTLDTVGPWDAHGQLGPTLTAHPKIDPGTGRIHAFATQTRPPYLTYLVFEPNGNLAHREVIDVRNPTMVHDFAITDRDVVFFELPAVYSVDDAVNRPGTMPYRWQPEVGARIGVMPLDGRAADLRWVDIEPCYVFHATNAWREGSDVVVDVSRLPSVFADGVTDGPTTGGDLRRWRIGTGAGALTWRQEVLVDRPFDLPTIRPDSVGRPHAAAFYVTTRAAAGGWEYAGIARLEPRSGSVDAWDAPAHLSAGEPLVVGLHVLTFVFDRTLSSSVLAVFEADHLSDGPIATVALPQRVPCGQHGTWLPGGVA